MNYVISRGQSSTGITLNYDSMYVNSGGVARKTVMNDGRMYVNGGTATSTSVYGGLLFVSSGGSIGWTNIYSSGGVYISSGGTATDSVIGGGGMSVFNGAAASRIRVEPGGMLYVSRGGIARQIVENGGYVVLENDVTVTFTPNQFRDMELNSGKHATLHSGTTATATAVDYGKLYVFSSGMASSTSLGRRGEMHVSSGGMASSTSLGSGGKMYVSSGGTARSATVSPGAMLYVSRGGTALQIVEDGGYVSVDSKANAVFVPNSLRDRVLTSGQSATIHSGTTANSTAVGSGGSLQVFSGGLLRHLQIAAGAYVYAEQGAVVDFDLTGRSTADPASVNAFSLIRGTPTCTITVSAGQAVGTYRLADGAENFDQTVTIRDTLGRSSSLSVGVPREFDGLYYTLTLGSGELTLTVGESLPDPTPDPTAATGAADDLNADGRADIVMTITQDGHGAYGATGAWLIGADQTASWGDLSQRNEGWEIFGTGRTAAEKAAADVYLRSTGNVIGAWTTASDGRVTGWETIGSFGNDTEIVGLGDFNGNGQTDLLLRNANGAVGCFFTNGVGWNYFQSLGGEWQIAAIGDFDGDGRDDAVLKHDAGFAGSWLTQSDGTMKWASLDTLPNGFEIVGAGDFDGDGVDDVLLRQGTYFGAWQVRNGTAAAWIGLGDLGNVAVEQIADFDGDGRDDLRIRTASGDLGIQLVKGADTLEWRYCGSVGAEWSTSLAAL